MAARPKVRPDRGIWRGRYSRALMDKQNASRFGSYLTFLQYSRQSTLYTGAACPSFLHSRICCGLESLQNLCAVHDLSPAILLTGPPPSINKILERGTPEECAYMHVSNLSDRNRYCIGLLETYERAVNRGAGKQKGSGVEPYPPEANFHAGGGIPLGFSA